MEVAVDMSTKQGSLQQRRGGCTPLTSVAEAELGKVNFPELRASVENRGQRPRSLQVALAGTGQLRGAEANGEGHLRG